MLHSECIKPPKSDLATLIEERKPQTVQQQFAFLSKISNNPYEPHPRAGKEPLLSKRNPSLHQHLLFSPKNSTDPDGKICNDYAPTSFRQRILHFIFFSSKLDRIYAKKIIRNKIGDAQFSLSKGLQTPINLRRRSKKRHQNTSPRDLVTPAQNEFTHHARQFEDFQEAVFTKGVLILRAFCSAGGFLIMND